MNVSQLIKYTEKPEIYTKGTAEMWVDEYISKHLLETHLNPEIDLASRKESTIEDTVKWISGQVSGENLTILDLGCGPGLYTEQLAELGHDVTGIDYSSRSIDYAEKSAKSKKLSIRYIHQNYLGLREECKYDLIYMIFTDFGVLTPEDRGVLLDNIYRALKPGGRFIFDVLNEKVLEHRVVKDWQVSECGFWRDKPYLVLSDLFIYEKEKAVLNQHVVVEESGGIEVYRFYNHGFSNADLQNITRNKGFVKTRCHESVLPGSEMYNSEDVTFCVTTKPL